MVCLEMEETKSWIPLQKKQVIKGKQTEKSSEFADMNSVGWGGELKCVNYITEVLNVAWEICNWK